MTDPASSPVLRRLAAAGLLAAALLAGCGGHPLRAEFADAGKRVALLEKRAAVTEGDLRWALEPLDGKQAVGPSLAQAEKILAEQRALMQRVGALMRRHGLKPLRPIDRDLIARDSVGR